MEFKGTKNEWCFCKNWDDNFIEIGTKEVHNIALVNKEYEEAEANAQLISAAPELLVALQSLANGVRERGYAGHLSDYLKQADTIIAKALGKEADDE